MRRTQPVRPLARRRATTIAPTRQRDDARADAEQIVLGELDAWRVNAIPDAATPLAVEDLVRLLRDCVASLDLDPAIAEDVTTNTVHYYRRKDIIDPPDGRTAAARWSVRHLWQIAGARLAGHLGLVTLAQARDAIRGADTATLLDFLAARVVDARARDTLRRSTDAPPAPRPVSAAPRPLVSRPAAAPRNGASEPATMIRLPGDVLCIVPANHAAHRSDEDARELGRALTRALLDDHRN